MATASKPPASQKERDDLCCVASNRRHVPEAAPATLGRGRVCHSKLVVRAVIGDIKPLHARPALAGDVSAVALVLRRRVSRLIERGLTSSG